METKLVEYFDWSEGLVSNLLQSARFSFFVKN